MAIDLEELRRIAKSKTHSSSIAKGKVRSWRKAYGEANKSQRPIKQDERAYYERRVRSIVAGQLGVPEAKIGIYTSFTEDLLADSLDMAELAIALEDAFQIEISEEAEEFITTVDLAVEYIVAYKEAR
jgi:acyl carrier protein